MALLTFSQPCWFDVEMPDSKPCADFVVELSMLQVHEHFLVPSLYVHVCFTFLEAMQAPAVLPFDVGDELRAHFGHARWDELQSDVAELTASYTEARRSVERLEHEAANDGDQGQLAADKATDKFRASSLLPERSSAEGRPRLRRTVGLRWSLAWSCTLRRK